ncbi:hypothetical protein [Nocardia brasiliensis]|uniref:hypothetical protein n=1 Tax=Nocardia brasiliensis TaxID=37326 RepID=UPI002456F3CC|nr:hypothetical protein [Nocardia brasiliensis]
MTAFQASLIARIAGSRRAAGRPSSVSTSTHDMVEGSLSVKDWPGGISHHTTTTRSPPSSVCR